MEKQKRVAIYARVPQTHSQHVARLQALLLPTDTARVFLPKSEWHVIADHADLFFDEWDKVIDMAKKRIIDVIAFPSIQDVPLSLFKIALTYDELHERGVSFLILSEMIDTSKAVGKLTFMMLMAVRDFQRGDGSND